MAAVEQGRIVWAWVSDSAAKSRKRRPTVVLTATEEIRPDVPIIVAAATTQFDSPPPKDHVLLPWHPQGKVRTQLRKPTAVVCSWLIELQVADIEKLGGVAPPRQLLEIIHKVNELRNMPPSDEGAGA